MKKVLKAFLIAIGILVFLIFLFRDVISNEITDAFKVVNKSLLTSYTSDSAKLKLLVGSLRLTNISDKDSVQHFYQNSIDIGIIIDSLIIAIDLNKTSESDLDISEEIITSHAATDTLFKKMGQHLSYAGQMSVSHFVKNKIDQMKKENYLFTDKETWIKNYFHLVPALASTTVLRHLKTELHAVTYKILNHRYALAMKIHESSSAVKFLFNSAGQC